MKKSLFSVVVIALLTTAAMAQKEVETLPYENYMQVTGVAEKEIVPDEIYVKIVLDESNPTKKEPIDKQDKDLLSALKKAGVDTEKNLSVSNLKGGYRSYVLRKNQGSVVKTYELKIDGATALDNVYRQLDAVNISDVSVVRTNHSKMKEYEMELKVEAVKNGQQQAKMLAEAVGQKIGRAIMIAEYGNVRSQYIDYFQDESMVRSSKISNGEFVGGTNEILPEFRKIKITTNVSVKFELK